jgi:hypothetical protein
VSRRARAGVLAGLGLIFALPAYALGHVAAADLALLAAGVVIGEILVLRLEDRSAVPLSYAVVMVLAAGFSFGEFAVTLVCAELIAYCVCRRPSEPVTRVPILLTRLVVGAATFAAYTAVAHLFDDRNKGTALLVSLFVAAVTQFVVDTASRIVMRRGSGWTTRGRLAWLAVASSGMLMAIGYVGVDDAKHPIELKIWGPLLFATPLLAAWYAFERLDQARLAYRQTIESLAMSPELAGLVPAGHAERVASLVGYIGNRLGLSESDLDDLEMAALLHHLGQVTLDDPDVAGRPDPAHVADVTGAMLGEIRPLARAGDIVAGDANDERRRIAVQVLRIASEYDDLTDGDGTKPDVALETLRTAPRYVYDERVLNALERAVGAKTRSAG